MQQNTLTKRNLFINKLIYQTEMKTLRLIGMAIVAIVMSVNFAACSDDDEDIDVNQLEGNWGLVLDEGYEYYEGEKESWSDSYDPTNPTEDCTVLFPYPYIRSL